MQEVIGVVAPEDLVGAGDRFSGDHLPLAAVAAHVRPPGGVDLLARCSAELHEGHAITAPQQLGVALNFNGGVIIEDRANHRSRAADRVTAACGEGEGNGFVGLDRVISRWINGEGGSGRTGSKSDDFSCSRRGAGVIRGVSGAGNIIIYC